MPDIKIDQQKEMAAAARERPADLGEKLKQSLESFGNAEKAKNLEQARKSVMEKISQTEKLAPAAVSQAGGLLTAQARRQKQIENVLAKGITEVYLNLAPAQRQEFKRAGEATARKINQLLLQTKINIGKIIKLIKKWLSLIPGVNKYFLEQEAKIKADEIIKMKNET